MPVLKTVFRNPGLQVPWVPFALRTIAASLPVASSADRSMVENMIVSYRIGREQEEEEVVTMIESRVLSELSIGEEAQRGKFDKRDETSMICTL